ncbi:HAD family hydrolase [Curvivirga sp.]|uniref:HAD family hydrolase n=1 Tax=Curvivirga sp. TaxID=2856848 RepID=UPI003B59F168
MIEVVAFDADDTLWHTEDIFVSTQNKLEEILTNYCETAHLHERMAATEKENVKLFGYGIKGFTLSMVETAIELSEGKISAEHIHEIIQLGKAMLEHPLRIMPNVEDVLKELHGKYKLAIVTKGDLLDQNNKIEQSGLAPYFDFLEVVSEKDTATYENLFTKWGDYPAERVMMIGNSLPSDVLPVLDIGGYGVHIPYVTTAAFERTDRVASGYRFTHLDNIKEIPAYLEQITLKYLI